MTGYLFDLTKYPIIDAVVGNIYWIMLIPIPNIFVTSFGYIIWPAVIKKKFASCTK